MRTLCMHDPGKPLPNGGDMTTHYQPSHLEAQWCTTDSCFSFHFKGTLL